MDCLDGDGMLGKAYSAMTLGVMMGTIEHAIAAMELSARQHFGKRIVIRYYSSALMYTNICEDKEVERRYGKGVLLVSVKKSILGWCIILMTFKTIMEKLTRLERSCAFQSRSLH